MIARYLLLSNVPVNQITIMAEINKLVQFLYAQMKASDIGVSSTMLESLNFEPWTSFEFITRMNGSSGPKKYQCLDYYKQ